jgi:hypothetical protein
MGTTVRLAGGPLHVGDRIAFELQAHFVEQPVSQSNWSGSLTEAGDAGQRVGIATEFERDLKIGTRVFRVTGSEDAYTNVGSCQVSPPQGMETTEGASHLRRNRRGQTSRTEDDFHVGKESAAGRAHGGGEHRAQHLSPSAP